MYRDKSSILTAGSSEWNEMEKGIFITGTDTGVGKTTLAGAIARTLRSAGVDVGVMKPVETGCRLRNGKLIRADATYLKQAAQSNDSLDLMNPYPYRAPLAPRAASQLEGKMIDFDTLVDAYHLLCRRHSFVIVEGAGGLLVPLTERGDILDLILLFKLPVLVVARSGLGTLNHTLLTLRCGSAAGIRFTGVVFNQTTPWISLADKTNPGSLTERTEVPFLGTFPFLGEKIRGERRIRRSEILLRENDLLRRTILDGLPR